MAKHNITIPAMGEGIFEATIVKWLKQKGDNVNVDESIAEIATDKVTTELPVSIDGLIIDILMEEGITASIGTTIAIVDDGIEEEKNMGEFDKINLGIDISKKQDIDVEIEKHIEVNENEKYFSPLVKEIIKKENISNEELSQIKGTATNNRITKTDLDKFLTNRQKQDMNKPSEIAIEKEIKNGENKIKETPNITKENNVIFPKADFIKNENDIIIEMDRVRKIIAENMVKSKRIAPHVTSFAEADLTNIVKWRENNKQNILSKHNVKITYTPIFIEAIAKSLKAFPLINTSLIDEKIIVKKNINIGMATALPNGNLIVPVIKNADELNLLGIAKKVNELSERARTEKLRTDDIQDGTFSLTNLGTFGSLIGTPIILQPQSAILATGIIKKKVVVIENENGDSIAIRNMMMLALSYDHRIIDGALAGNFLNKIVELLENFEINLEL